MRILEDIKLDFDDVLICPKYSKAGSRADVKLNRKYNFLNSKRVWEGIPLVAANMDVVGTFAMSQVMAKHQMSTCLHKHYDLSKLIDFYLKNKEISKSLFYTVGITENDLDKLNAFANEIKEPLNICVDAANGYSVFFVDRVKLIREKHPEAVIMAGNVVTPEMTSELLLNGGADIVKVGIGSGSVCTTRLIAGVGYPQLSAVIECADAAHGLGGHICSDGGCKIAGDVVKAIAGGADFVMLGGMLAGTAECEGDWQTKYDVKWPENGDPPWTDMTIIKKSLKFYGMSSREAQDKYNGGVASHRAAEGKCVEIPYKGPAEDTLLEVMGGLRSACTYVGAMELKYLSKCTSFVRVNRTHNTVFSR